MAKIDDFKNFVRSKPELIQYVNSGQTTWQKLFETWDLYGSNHNVWQNYINSNTNFPNGSGLKDIFDNFRNINVDSLSQGLSGLQKVLGLAQELLIKEETAIPNQQEPYTPRPLYRRFDD